MDIHEKIKLLQELKSNPMADNGNIERLKKSLEWVDLNQLNADEIRTLLT